MSRLKTKKSTEPFARKLNSKATFPAKTNTVSEIKYYVIQNFRRFSQATGYLPVFSITGLFLFVATYSAQQSTKHRKNENRSRWYDVRVRGFEPFIHNFPDDQNKAELRKDATHTFFIDDKKDDDETKGQVPERVLGTFVDAFERISKVFK